MMATWRLQDLVASYRSPINESVPGQVMPNLGHDLSESPAQLRIATLLAGNSNAALALRATNGNDQRSVTGSQAIRDLDIQLHYAGDELRCFSVKCDLHRFASDCYIHRGLRLRCEWAAPATVITISTFPAPAKLRGSSRFSLVQPRPGPLCRRRRRHAHLVHRRRDT